MLCQQYMQKQPFGLLVVSREQLEIGFNSTESARGMKKQMLEKLQGQILQVMMDG